MPDNGELHYSRMFPVRELVLQEAAERKADLLAGGWVERLPAPE
jgi:hypothetical protein